MLARRRIEYDDDSALRRYRVTAQVLAPEETDGTAGEASDADHHWPDRHSHIAALPK